MTPKLRAFLVTAAPLVVLDVASKELAVRYLTPYFPRPVLGDVFRLTLAYNQYGAMGLTLGSWSRAVFGTLAVIALVVLGVMLRRTAPDRWLQGAVIGLLVAGAAGNLWDRLRSGRGVVDFIDVGTAQWRFWTFNVADSALTVGAVALAVLLWREDAARAGSGAARR
jgi:signal peptidase II